MNETQRNLNVIKTNKTLYTNSLIEVQLMFFSFNICLSNVN